MCKGSRTRGFTLVEIMIVVLIIGILLAVAVPNFIRARTNSRLQTAIANLKQIDTAKQQFVIDKGLAPSNAVNDATDLTPKYLAQWPVGPVAGATYVAQAAGNEPTLNNMTAAQLDAACAGSSPNSNCPF